MARSIKLGDDGIWYAAGSERVSYPEGRHEACCAFEGRSFWFAHRNACIAELVDRFPPPDGGPILDLGGGNGFIAKALLERGYDVVLVEPGLSGARNAKRRGLPAVICGTLESAGFVDESAGAVGLFDVIEHNRDDAGLLRSVHGALKPRGRVYLTAPAYPWLWSGHDVAAGHHRGYTLTSLREVLRDAGFSVDYATCIFRFLPVPIFLSRVLPPLLRLKSQDRVAEESPANSVIASPAVDGLVERMLRGEARSIRHGKVIRFGGSCLVAGTKR